MSIPIDLLKNAAEEDRLAHLLLFHGSGAEERFRAVLELFLVLNCKENQRPCRECPSCKKILSGNHPDMHILRPEKTSIGIEQILGLQKKIYRKTYESKYRVCLLEEAEKLTLPAANALLKIAEEPPENTIIVFSAANAEGIIETLRSRAQAVYFSPPGEEAWENEKEVFRMSGGDPDLARKIIEVGPERVRGWLQKYLELLDSGDFLKTFELFPLEREESQIFLQVLAVVGKDRIIRGESSPEFLSQISQTSELIRKQVNHRLAIEVLALHHLRLGGTKVG